MEQLHKQLIHAYTTAHPQQNGKSVQLNVAGIWKEMKAINDSEQLACAVKQQIHEWNKKKAMKKKGTLLSFWSKPMQTKVTRNETTVISNTFEIKTVDKPEKEGHGFIKSKPCPSQDNLNEKKGTLESEINLLHLRNNQGLLSFEDKKLLKQKEADLHGISKKLTKIQKATQRQRDYRIRNKRKMEEAFLEFPEIKRKN